MSYNMTRNILWLCFFSCFTGALTEDECELNMLLKILNAFDRSLQFMDAHKTETILDSMSGVRAAADQLDILLEVASSWNFEGKEDALRSMEHLKDTAERIVSQNIPYLEEAKPPCYEDLKGLLESGSWKLRYFPSRRVNRSLQVKPLLCNESKPDPKQFNDCLSEVSSTDMQGHCNITLKCVEFMTKDKLRDYELTHEALFFMSAETHDCFPSLEELGVNGSRIQFLQEYFCANMLRDAEDIAQNNYPKTHRDLFLEQLGFCGMLGFSDFWQVKWANKAIEWQEEGCYKHPRYWECVDDLSITPSKIQDEVPEDDCSVHMTTVALMALVANLRFCAENFTRASQKKMKFGDEL